MALVTGLTIYSSRIDIAMGNRALSGKISLALPLVPVAIITPCSFFPSRLLVFPGDTAGGAAVKCQRYFYRLSKQNKS